MGYIRIIIILHDGNKRSGVRRFAEPMNVNDIREQVWLLSSQVLGRGNIADISLQQLPPDDPAVAALILREEKNRPRIEPSNGQHPFVKQQQRKPPR